MKKHKSPSAAIKKISVDALRPGMYIADLGAGWREPPFLRNNFSVSNDATVLRVQKLGIREIYIDTSRGLDAPLAPTREAVERELDEKIVKIAAQVTPPAKNTHAEEIFQARKVRTEANALIRDMLCDVRMGKQVRSERLEPLVEAMTQSILRNGGALLSLCRVKDKDNYTFQHSVSMCALLIAFSLATGSNAETTRVAGVGGLLHDIGKIRIPDLVLNKPDKLSDEEFAQMKCHVVESRTILEATPGIDPISISVALQHHERHDGTGYPFGLKGNEISPIGQMAAICDVYDALTSERCYHHAMAPHEALRRIFEWSKYHFNPSLAQQFIRIIGIYPVGSLVLLESGRLAVVLDQTEAGLLQPLLKVFYDTKRLRYVEPYKVDLSRSFGHGGGDRIIGHERPEKWCIDMKRISS